MARTKAQWEARSLELLEQADDLASNVSSDAASFGSRISALSRLSAAICQAIDSKVIK